MSTIEKKTIRTGITEGAMARLAIKAGAEQVSAKLKQALVKSAKAYARKLVRGSLQYTRHRGGRTLAKRDVAQYLRLTGVVMYV